MSKITMRSGKRGIRRAYRNLEDRMLIAAGRQAIRSRVRTVKQVSRRAARAALMAGTVAAATVVVREVRKRI